jgi:MoaA/NifB/PqqE/SkfB family radical SAM enzyme
MKRMANGLFKRFKTASVFLDRVQVHNTALNLLERTLQKTIVKSDPFLVQVEVTNKCNLNCVFCSRHSHPLKLGDLSLDLLPEIIKLSRRSRELILFGYGEPLLSEAFYMLLKRVESARCSFTTNGLLFTSEIIDRITRDSNRPLHNVTFSIDGANPPTYLSIRERSNFQSVWHNLKNLSEYKARYNLFWPEIYISYVAMRRNLEELPQIIEKASSLNVSQINVFHLNVWDESYKDESLIHYPELTKQVFSEAQRKARKLGLGLDIPVEISVNHSSRQQKLRNSHIPKCYQPWSYSYIRNDGSVQACCFSENFVMGNLNEKSFEEIWNDKPYQTIRATVNRTLLPDCRRCEFRFRYVPSPNDSETYIKLQPRKK